jgi:hypothetical protein
VPVLVLLVTRRVCLELQVSDRVERERELAGEEARRAGRARARPLVPARRRYHRPVDVGDRVDNPLERLELLAGNEQAIDTFLDELDVHGPRERRMLRELGRVGTLADSERFPVVHRRAIAALETLARHGYHGSRAGAPLGPLKVVARFLVELVARYVVVSYLRSVATSLRSLYWLREIESPGGSPEWRLLRRARRDAQALDQVFTRRSIGLPTFVIGGVLVPIGLSILNLSSRIAVKSWLGAVVASVISTLIVVAIAWVLLRGAAMASRRIRLTAEAPLDAVWRAIGNCGDPPEDQSRKLATVGIVLSVAAWIVIPVAVGLALATT